MIELHKGNCLEIDNGAIVLFAQAPYDKILAVSNLKMFKYEWIIK